MNLILFDREPARTALLPLTFTRPVADLRVGALTIAEKWQRMLQCSVAGYVTEPYLAAKYPMPDTVADDTIFVAGDLLPDPGLVAMIGLLQPGQALAKDGSPVVVMGSKEIFDKADTLKAMDVDCRCLTSCIDIFKLNGEEIRNDFRILTDGRSSAALSPTNTVIGDSNDLFVEEGCDIECATFNTKHGPIYVAAGVEIMEGSRLRGPLAVMQGAKVKMNSMVYGDTTVGPECRVAGELSNAVFQGYSNKAHDGVALNCVIGQWCNLGAACTASNLKNNYAKIKVWSYAKNGFVKTDEQFCGLIMGDQSKMAINTSLNTATTVGVGVNFYGAGFPRTFIPSFSFGSPGHFTKVDFDDFIATARIVMARRHVELTEADIAIYRHIYDTTE